MTADKKGDGIKLADAPVGDLVYVTSIGGAGSVRGRIMAMGLVPGTAVRVVRKAPMGDPLELSVKGYNLSLRSREAEMIIVSTAPSKVAEGGGLDG